MVGKRKRALTCPGPPTDGKERTEGQCHQFSGATQPLGKRTIFLGHDKFVSMESSCHISSHHSLQCKCLTLVGTLATGFMSLRSLKRCLHPRKVCNEYPWRMVHRNGFA